MPLSEDPQREDYRLVTLLESGSVCLLFHQGVLLARQGLYYCQRTEDVQCAFCYVTVLARSEENAPRPVEEICEEHTRLSPECPVLTNRDNCVNIPASEIKLELIRDQCRHLAPDIMFERRKCDNSTQDKNNQKLTDGDDRRQCIVCMDNQRSVVFLPCKHLVCCDACCPLLSACPVCREHITTVITLRYIF